MPLSFECNDSPVSQADVDSPGELNVTALSLPADFDDSLCLDIYKDLASEDVNVEKSKAHGEQLVTPSNDIGSATRYEELESRIRQLLAENLELKEKVRMYDNLKARHAQQEVDIKELTSKLGEQASLYESCASREKELQHQVLELKRKANFASIESEHSSREIELVTTRAEKAEVDCETNARELKALLARHNDSVSRHNSEMDELRKKTDIEIERIRIETSHEILSSRKCQEEAFATQIKLLTDARDYAIEQSKTLQQELNSLRSEKACKDVEASDIVNEYERQLSDVRSDLKVKLLELNTITAAYDRITEESKQLKIENNKSKDELQKMHINYVKLERESAIEQSRLEEIIRQKTDELEIHQHDDLLFRDGDIPVTARRQSRNSLVLTKKCLRLQKELSLEKERNDALCKQADNDKRLYHELTSKSNKDASGYILAVVNERDNDLSRLNMKLHTLQIELNKTIQERDGIAARLADISDRRKSVKMMQEIVGEGKKQRAKMDGSDKENIEDLSEHIIYHNKA